MQTKQELIAPFASGKILDIGWAQEPNYHLKGEVYGVDIVGGEKPSNYKEVRVADLNVAPLPYADGYFDTVTMGCVLAHVASPLKVLVEINRVLKPGGTLVLTSPNPQYYWEVAMNTFYHFFKNRVSQSKKEEHFCSFSRFDMRTIQGRAGFAVQKELGYMFALVKTPFRFNPIKHPGMAYEIVYISRRVGKPELYTITEASNKGGGITRVPTSL